jgi:hypothetical protein
VTRNRKGAIALVCLVILAALVVYFRERSVGVLRTVQATLTQIDLAQRTATVQFIHPRSGETISLKGMVSADCSVEVDGRPAALADLVIGDRAWVQGVISRNDTVSAVRVWVYRKEPVPPKAPATSAANATHGP